MDNCNVSPEKCVFSKMAMRGGGYKCKETPFLPKNRISKNKIS